MKDLIWKLQQELEGGSCDVYLSIYEWAGINGYLVPWVSVFSEPKIPEKEAEKCIRWVKEKNPTIPIDKIVRVYDNIRRN